MVVRGDRQLEKLAKVLIGVSVAFIIIGIVYVILK